MKKTLSGLILMISFIFNEIQIHSQIIFINDSINSNLQGILIDSSNKFTPEYFLNGGIIQLNQSSSQVPVFSHVKFWHIYRIMKSYDESYIEIYCPNIKEVHLFPILYNSDSIDLKLNRRIEIFPVLLGKNSITAHIPSNSKAILMSLEVSKFTQFEIKVLDESAFFKKERMLNVFHGFSFGILLLLFFYHLILFIKVKEKLYIFYLLQISISAIIVLSHNHLVSIQSYSYINEIIMDIFQISVIALCIAFLELKKFKRSYYFILLSFIPFILLLRLFNIFCENEFTNILIHLERILLYIIILIIAIISSFQNQKSFHFFIYPWLFILITQLLATSNQLRIIKINDFGLHASETGILLNIILLALAFGNKLNIYKNEKLIAEANELKALIAKDTIIKEQNDILENLIQERNKEIIEKIHLLSSQKAEIELQNDKIRSSNLNINKLNQQLSYQNVEIAEHNKELEKLDKSLEETVNNRTLKLLEAKNKAITADNLKTSFLTNLDQEINMPMNAISGFSAMLNNPALTIEQRNNFLNTINFNIEILLDSIDNMVLLARIQSNLTKPRIGYFNLNQLFIKTNEYVENHLIYPNKNINIKIDFHQFSQNLVVNSDYDKIWQIIIKLLTFAAYNNSDAFINLEISALDFLNKKSNSKSNLSIYLSITYIEPNLEKQNWMLAIFNKKVLNKNKFTKINEIGAEIAKAYIEMLEAEIEITIINIKDILITVQVPVY